ncbi:MAG TPA: cobyrinic acid a,c-diamide synthase [Bacteroidales bacterium]|nr:cobyrinic acid a,c-diamide synthase [Bacteroidales bacterium]
MKIAIASGKGGTGKTFVSTNLFYAAQSLKHSVCLVDCDAEEPNVAGFLSGEVISKITATQKIPVFDTEKCTYCRKCSDYCEYNAIFVLPPAQFIKLTPELCHSCGACLLACEYNAITETDMPIGEITRFNYAQNGEIIEGRLFIGLERSTELIKLTQKAVSDNFEIVLYDSPPGTSCPFVTTVNNANAVLLVAEPTPFGLNDLKLSVEVLKTMNKPIFAIINKFGMGNNEVETYLNLQRIEILAKIPYTTQIAVEYSNGKIISQYNSTYKNIFEQAINRLCKQPTK